MGEQRSSRPGPRGSRRPGPRARLRGPSRPLVAGAEGPARPGQGRRPRRSRLTGRAVVLLVVCALLTISYASSLRAYLQQRTHIAELKSAIAAREASIDTLEREKRRWQDPAYVRMQARERFGYLMPGEVGYQVIDEDGRPLGAQTSLADPQTAAEVPPTAWWTTALRSVELAGHPPTPRDEPAEEIDAPPASGRDRP